MLRVRAVLGEDRDDVAQRLRRLRDEIVRLEPLRGVPADLAGDEHERAARGDAVRVAPGWRPAGRFQNLHRIRSW